MIDQGGNMSAAEIHASLATTCILYAFILAAWGIWRYLRKEGLNGSYWGALVVGEVLFLAQGLIGVSLWLSGLRPAQLLHLLYGVVSALAIPAVFVFFLRDEIAVKKWECTALRFYSFSVSPGGQ
jgi:hypothetical protein